MFALYALRHIKVSEQKLPVCFIGFFVRKISL